MKRGDGSSIKCCHSNTLKLILRSATAFITKPSEASQARTSRLRLRRCLARGTSSIGLTVTTPPRRNPRGSVSDSESESEPDSPRVSCVGQIEIAGRGKKKRKRKRKKKKIAGADDEENPEKRRWIWEKKTMRVGAERSKVGIETTPDLGRMRRFSSGRGSLSDFEW